MACILISCLSAHTLCAVPLISRASVVQSVLATLILSSLAIASLSSLRGSGAVHTCSKVLRGAVKLDSTLGPRTRKKYHFLVRARRTGLVPGVTMEHVVAMFSSLAVRVL